MDRIETLLAAMTLDEKIGQLTMMSSTLAVTGPVLPGDVIVRVGSEAVKTPSEVAKQVKAAKEADRNAVMLLINHQGDQRFVALKLPKA